MAANFKVTLLLSAFAFVALTQMSHVGAAEESSKIECYVCTSATSGEEKCGATVDSNGAVKKGEETETNSTESEKKVEAENISVYIYEDCTYCYTSKSTTSGKSVYTRSCAATGTMPKTSGCASASGVETCVTYCDTSLCNATGGASSITAALTLVALLSLLRNLM